MFMNMSYEDWITKLKECNGYYEQEDNFYEECWTSGLSPQEVADYLNSEIPM